MKEYEKNGLLLQYQQYLMGEKGASANTLSSYMRDLQQFYQWLSLRGRESLGNFSRETILAFQLYLEAQGKSSASITRYTASIHSFCRWMYLTGRRGEDPSHGVKAKREGKQSPHFLTEAEVELLLAQPNSKEERGLRDRAMLELLYAVGLRVTELLNLELGDINFSLGLLYCRGRRGDCAVPLRQESLAILRDYQRRVRPSLAAQGETALFVNKNGHRMTRQGFWKLLKGYQQQAGIEKEITPHTLRHSCAMHLLEQGADAQIICTTLGHADLSYTKLYMAALEKQGVAG